MQYRSWCLAVLLSAGAVLAADKKLPIEEASNELVDVSAVPLDKDQTRQELGSDLSAGFVVVRIKFRPVSDKPIQISLDDFLLVSAKDGERSAPFAPSQIAGNTTLVVTPQGNKNGGTARTRPTFGIGGLYGGTGTTNNQSQVDSKIETTHSDKENPLLAALTEKVLPEKEATEETSGLLYFQMNEKLKTKDMELHYKGPGGRLALRFRP
jgi:hypothetical protein